MNDLIIVDTSIWIDYFNGVVTPHTDFLDYSLQRSKIGIYDEILMAMLQGFRHANQYQQAKNHS